MRLLIAPLGIPRLPCSFSHHRGDHELGPCSQTAAVAASLRPPAPGRSRAPQPPFLPAPPRGTEAILWPLRPGSRPRRRLATAASGKVRGMAPPAGQAPRRRPGRAGPGGGTGRRCRGGREGGAGGGSLGVGGAEPCPRPGGGEGAAERREPLLGVSVGSWAPRAAGVREGVFQPQAGGVGCARLQPGPSGEAAPAALGSALGLPPLRAAAGGGRSCSTPSESERGVSKA